MIKTGVIGFGLSARVFHLPFIIDSGQFDLAAVSTGRVEAAREALPGVRICRTAAELIRIPDIHLVVITAPNPVHYPLAQACLLNGKHVVIEKPVTVDVSQAEALAEMAKDRDLIVSPFHNRRWDADFLTLKKLLAENRLGDVRVFESRFDRFCPEVQGLWRERPGPGSGNWFDLGPHLIDQAVCLFGMPDQVTGRCLALRDHSDTTDYFHALLHYPGCEVLLHAGPFAAGPNLRFHVQGTRGSFIKYGVDPQEAQAQNGMLPSDSAFGKEDSAAFGILYSKDKKKIVPSETGTYQTYYSLLADAVSHGAPVPVRIEDGLQVMRLLELVISSSDQKKTLPVVH